VPFWAFTVSFRVTRPMRFRRFTAGPPGQNI